VTIPDIAERAKSSIVVVETPLGIGTAFAVAPGVFATNLHVVAGADRIVLRITEARRVDVSTVIAFDPEHDLALLEASTARDLPALALGNDTALRAGDGVIAVGTPQGLDASVSTGIVAAVREVNPNLTVLQITAPISPGSSGGPLFDDGGQVVGVTTMLLIRGQNLNFAVPARYIKALLSKPAQRLTLGAFAQLQKEARERAERARRPPFPKSVAGFDLGWTFEMSRSACPRKLKVGKNYAECSTAPVQVPFAQGPVRLFFSNGRLITVGLTARSFEDVQTVLGGKYGPPGTGLTGDGLRWQLNGGQITVGRRGNVYDILYVPDAWDVETNY
jgi:hypothetical protein